MVLFERWGRWDYMSLKSKVCLHQHLWWSWSCLMIFIIIWRVSSGKHDLADLESNSAPATYIFRVRVNRQIHVDTQCREAKGWSYLKWAAHPLRSSSKINLSLGYKLTYGSCLFHWITDCFPFPKSFHFRKDKREFKVIFLLGIWRISERL